MHKDLWYMFSQRCHPQDLCKIYVFFCLWTYVRRFIHSDISVYLYLFINTITQWNGKVVMLLFFIISCTRGLAAPEVVVTTTSCAANDDKKRQHDNLSISVQEVMKEYPDSKVHGANMGPTWVLSAPGGPHVGTMNLAIRVSFCPAVKNPLWRTRMTWGMSVTWEIKRLTFTWE